MPIVLKPLPNSSIHAAGYDAGSRAFFVQFNAAGKISQYSGVPQSIADDFHAAESKGKFIAANIRGQFEHLSIEPDATET